MHATHWGGPGEDYRLSKISSTTIDLLTESRHLPRRCCSRLAASKARRIPSPWFEVVMTTDRRAGNRRHYRIQFGT